MPHREAKQHSVPFQASHNPSSIGPTYDKLYQIAHARQGGATDQDGSLGMYATRQPSPHIRNRICIPIALQILHATPGDLRSGILLY